MDFAVSSFLYESNGQWPDKMLDHNEDFGVLGVTGSPRSL